MNSPLPLSPPSNISQPLQPGVYKHYKGTLYKVLFIARHSEDPAQEFVVIPISGNEGDVDKTN